MSIHKLPRNPRDIEVKLNAWMRDTLKPGDSVLNWGYKQLTIKKVNRTGITTTTGTRYTYDEIRPDINLYDLTNSFREWEANQNAKA